MFLFFAGYSSGAPNGGGEQIFKCSFPGCPKAYYTTDDLVLHCNMRHGGVGADAAGGGTFLLAFWLHFGCVQLHSSHS